VLKEWVKLARAGKLTGDMEMLTLRFTPVEELYDSENDPHMVKDVVGDPEYAEMLELMRKRLDEWMVETRDLGILEESEVHRRAEGKSAHWEVGQELDDATYRRILETANLQIKGQQAVPELKASSKDADPAIRFWGVLGLAVVTQTAGPEIVQGIVPMLKDALQDENISVRLTAAEGLCNLGHYGDAVDVLSRALADPSISARVRSSGILDTQPPEASNELEVAADALEAAMNETDIKKMPGILYGLNEPFTRALKAVTGKANYYRWGMGASGSPENPLMVVQQAPFAPKEDPVAIKNYTGSKLKELGGTITVSSEQGKFDKAQMQDGSFETFWHSRYKPAAPAPHFVVFERPGSTPIAGLSYHRHVGSNGHIKKYAVYVSDDG
jgi:hypothetical protein